MQFTIQQTFEVAEVNNYLNLTALPGRKLSSKITLENSQLFIIQGNTIFMLSDVFFTHAGLQLLEEL